MLSLPSVYSHFSRKKQIPFSWHKLGCEFFQNESLEEEVIRERIHELASNKPESPAAATEPLRQLLFLAIATRNPERLRPLLRKLQPFCFWKDLQLNSALLALIGRLIGEPTSIPLPELLLQGAALAECGGHHRKWELPKLKESAELACIWAVLGYLEGDQTLLRAALMLASWQTKTLDHTHCPFHSLWATEEESRLDELLVANTALFYLSFRLMGNERFLALARTQITHLISLSNDSEQGNLPLVPTSLMYWLEKQVFMPLLLKTDEKEEIEDLSVALVGHRNSQWSGACTLCGQGTGLGAFHQNKIKVCNFGPQILPLGDFQKFGIQRSSSDQVFPEGISIQRKLHGFSLKGWTALNGDPSIWMQMDSSADENSFKMTINFEGMKKDQNLAFIFLVSAAQAVIPSFKTLFPSTLERYRGESSKILFEHEKEQLILFPHQEGEMEVIPLAGAPYFWRASFLIVFPINISQKNYSWTLRV